MKRLEAFTVREANDKSYWTRIGVAFPSKGGGFSVLLDAMPAPIDGKYAIIIRPAKTTADHPEVPIE